MATSLRKQAQQAPKYVLHNAEFGYVAENQQLRGVRFTNDINAAMQYSIGFDNPEIKKPYWQAAAKMQEGKAVSFDIVNVGWTPLFVFRV